MEIVTKKRVAELDCVHKRATPGPWVLWDGCSWRRFASEATGKTVIEPYNCKSDRHPDLLVSSHDQAMVVQSRNSLPLLLSTIEQFAEALRNQWYMCACSDGCAACKKTHALLAQYDGATTEGGK